MNWLASFFSRLFNLGAAAIDAHASATTRLVVQAATTAIASEGADMVSSVLTKHGVDPTTVEAATTDIISGVSAVVASVGIPKAAATIAAIGGVSAPTTSSAS